MCMGAVPFTALKPLSQRTDYKQTDAIWSVKRATRHILYKLQLYSRHSPPFSDVLCYMDGSFLQQDDPLLVRYLSLSLSSV